MRNFTLGLFFILISGFAFGQVLSPEMEFAQEKLTQREEFYFTFHCENRDLVREMSRQLSIDKVQGSTVFAYANPQEFAVFLTYNLAFEPVYEYYNSPKALTMATTTAQMASWDRYPTHAVYLQMLDNFVANYPTLCRLETIGTSVNGYTMKCLVISDNVANDEDEPEFWWSGTMHGDETTGFIMELRFADYLLSNYGTNSQVANLVNNMEIYINPLANPDGTYYGSAGGLTVSGARRANANNIDLNRNFPTANGDPYTMQPEIQAMMDYATAHDFVMSANTHGGIELMNYPWDTWQSWENINPDDTWWQYVAFVYRDEVALDAPATYFEGPGDMDYGAYNNTGVTHGADWYYAIGSRQDYMNYFQHIKEITIELSDTKLLGTENLNTYWGYNRDAMMLYTEQALYGFRGIVTDACSGTALSDVKVEIVGHDQDGTEVYSSAPVGNYHRPIIAGTWNVTFSKTGYTSKTLPVTVLNDQSTRLDVSLYPTSVAIPGFTASETSIFVGESVNFTNTTSGTVTSRTWTFEGGNPATSTVVTPGAITYNAAGTYDVTLAVISSGCAVEELKTDYINVTIPGAPVVGFTADVTSSCSGIIQFANSTVDADSYLWDFGDGQTSTEENPQHVYTADGTYTVALTATNAYGNNSMTRPNYITIALPDAPVTTGAESCAAASLTLNASGSGTLQWWNAPTNGNLITTGTTYTNTFASTTTYYVQSGVSAGNYTVGNTQINTNGGNHTSNAYYLIFTAYDDFTLVSVQVNSSTVGNRVIELRNSGGTLIQSITAPLIVGTNTVTLNFDIPQGTNYQLRCGSTTPNLYRNNSGTSFPYTVPGVVSITGTNASDINYYYYYYNWVVSYDGGCVSSRTPVTASILGTPTDVTVTGGGTQCGGSMTLNATGGTGGTIYWQNTTSNGTNTTTASSSQAVSASGTYYFRALAGTSCWGNQGSATVTINPVPTAVTVSGGGTQCGGSMTLSATGGTGGTIYWQGTTSGGTSTTTASSSQSVSASGTYYFRSMSAAGCWCLEGSATVTINPLPSDVTVTGGGTQCGGSMTLNATGGTGGTIYWQNTTSNGTSTTTASSSQAVSASGTYYFRSQSSLGCWGNQGLASVTINPLPTAVTVTGGGTQCGGSMTLSATGGTGGTIYWQGPTSGGTSTTTASSSQSVSASGTYYFRSMSAAGCWGPEGSATVTINPLPSDVTVTGAGTQCGGSMTLNATGGTGGTIYWQNTTSNGTSTTTASSSQTVSASGTYYFRSQSSLGCWGNQGSAIVAINPLPTVVAVTGGGTQCGGSMTLSATGGTGGTIYWQGTTSGGTSTTTASSSQSVSASGTYYFRSQSALGCWGPEGSATVTINPLAGVVSVSGGGAQCGGSMTLNATGGTGGTIYWQNTTSNGTSIATASSSQTVASSGTYYFRAQTSLGCWGTQGSAVVTINPAVSVSVSTTPETSPGANNGTATASASAGTAPYLFTWQSPYTGNPLTGLTGGTYCVTVQDFNNCTASACGTVSTNGAAPVADFNADVTEGCDNLTVTFTDQSSNFPTSWAWDFGDGATSAEQNPVHQYTTTGYYTVELVVTNATGSDDLIINNYITVGETPDITLSMTQTTFGNNEGTALVVALGGAMPYEYHWSGPSGFDSMQASLDNLEQGEYCVTVTEMMGCEATDCISVTSESAPAPVAAFNADVTEGCDNLSVAFTDQSSNFPTSWAWDFGDGATSTVQNPVHEYITIGYYTVTLIATNATGSDDIIVTDYIQVGETPTLELSMTQETLAGNDGTATVSATGGSAPYHWEWTNGSNNSNITGLIAGEYCVTVTEYGNGCQATACIDVTQESFSAPVANFEADNTEACGTLTVHFTDLSLNSPTAWEWTFGDGEFSTEQNPIHVYSEAGIYTVQLVATNAFGGDQILFNEYIVVFEKPVLAFDVTNESAEGMSDGSIELTISGGTEPYTINWSNGVHELLNSGLTADIYSVAVIDDNDCMSTGIAEVETLTKISDEEISLISVYPNPSNGTFTIESANTISEIQIYDAVGKLCYSSNEISSEIVVSEKLNPGIYILKIFVNNEMQALKMIIE